MLASEVTNKFELVIFSNDKTRGKLKKNTICCMDGNKDSLQGTFPCGKLLFCGSVCSHKNRELKTDTETCISDKISPLLVKKGLNCAFLQRFIVFMHMIHAISLVLFKL